MKYTFKARIYKTGINWCVDVPERITLKLQATKGYIRIKGTINGAVFAKSLVPVKSAPYRLFVNSVMMKNGDTALGKVATFAIEQDMIRTERTYAPPAMLQAELKKQDLLRAFHELTPARRKDIIKYLAHIKTDMTLRKNINKVIAQLKKKVTTVRIP
jgi:hypothetical protein